MSSIASDCQIGGWLDEYSVGNETLDGQHKKLLKMCQKMGNCLSDNTKVGDSLFHEILNDLAEYAKIHFDTEETILSESGYPDLAAHILEHNEYFEWLTALTFEASEGKINKEILRRRVADWWINHICESDMAYRDYMQV